MSEILAAIKKVPRRRVAGGLFSASFAALLPMAPLSLSVLLIGIAGFLFLPDLLNCFPKLGSGWRSAIRIEYGLLIGLLCLWPLLRPATPSPKVISVQELQKFIFLGERYGREWQGTNEAEIPFWRREEQPDVLRKPYNPNLSENPGSWPRLTPMLYHHIHGLVIHRATIYLKIPKNIDVIPLPGHIEPPPAQQWTVAEVDSQWRHYYTMVAGATERVGAGVIQSLALKFPGPGTYPVEYILSLTDTTPIRGLGDIEGEFQFEIFDGN